MALTASDGANLYLPSLTSSACTSEFLQSQCENKIKCFEDNKVKRNSSLKEDIIV